MMAEDMQPVYAEIGVPEEMRSPPQHIPLQVACNVIYNQLGGCKAHTGYDNHVMVLYTCQAADIVNTFRETSVDHLKRYAATFFVCRQLEP